MKKNYMKWKASMLLCFLFATTIFSSVQAQVSAYGFSTNLGTYTAVTGGTQVHVGTTDDAISAALPIGFNFVYNGTTYTTLKVNSNGWASFGTTTATGTYTPLSTTGTHNPCLAPLGRDLQGGATGAEVRVETQGTAPNRVFVVNWINYRRFAGTQSFNFQIQLTETSNLVKFVYGTMTDTGSNADYDCGITGTTNADFNARTSTTSWATSTAAVTNAGNMTISSTVFPASGRTFVWGVPPATPPTPTEVVGPITCASGTNIEIASAPSNPDVIWYWQGTNATGTSTANSTSAPYNIMSNGTYYVRAFNTVSGIWSSASSSIVINSIPVEVTPPAPTADINPSCVTTGSTLTAAAATAPVVNYWQTVANGTSFANDAASTMNAPTSGTYYLSAYNTTSSCWSQTSSLAVIVGTAIPLAPTTATTTIDECSGAVSIPMTVAAGLNTYTYTLTKIDSYGDGWNGYAITVYADGTPVLNNVTLAGGFNETNTFTVTEGQVITWAWTGVGSFAAEVSFSISNQVPTVVVGPLAQAAPLSSYNVPGGAPYTINWYDAATMGNTQGNGLTLDAIATPLMPTATSGTYEFYAAQFGNGCESATRTLITVNIVDVNADLIPVDATCNGGENGSFTLGTVECGTEPFLYSVDGGPFAAIPTDLVAGTYSIVIQDDIMNVSAPISVVVGQPAVPTISFANVGYYSADIAWVSTGDETSWILEYGPVGFTPGTGTIETVTSSPFTATGLDLDTDYDVYLTPVCGTSPQSAGPVVLSTNAGFFTFDNACGPGFMDISGTGTNLNLTDELEAGITLPWAWTVNGVTVNTITVGNNGGVLFNTLTGNVGYTATGNGMFPYVQDLGTPNAGGGVYYESIGTAPNRQFIIMWDDLASWLATDGSTFELVVDEATNEVYYIYDDVEMSNIADDYGADAEIALNTANGNAVVSMNNATYLTNNSCVHFYNTLCPNAIVTASTVAQEQIDITWNAGAYGETEWTIIYGPAGFDPLVSGTTVNTTNTNISVPGLTQVTEYDFYIYSECALDNLTSEGLLVTYTTLPWCNTPTTLGGSTAVDSLFTTWNYTEVVGAPQTLTGFNIQYGEFGFDLYNGTTVAANGLNFADTIPTTLLAGGVYQIYVQSVCGTDTSNYAGPITVVAPITNDAVCTPQMLNVDGTVYTFNNTGATAQAGEGAIITGSNPAGYNNTILPFMEWGSPTIEGSNWYTFVAPASGSLWFSGQDEDFFATQIAIYEVADCANFGTFELVAASDQGDIPNDLKLAPHFTVCGLTPGATYYVLHDAWSNGFGGLPIFGQYSIKMTEIVLEAGNYVDVVNACAGATVELFDGVSGNDAGGVWTSSTTNLNQGITGSMFNSAGFAYDQFEFEYRVTEGCAYDTILTQVEIYAPSSAGVDGTITACRNEPIYLLSGLTGNIDLGGQWYNPSNNQTNVSITTGNIPGSYNYDYIVTNGVCPNDTSNILVTVGSCDYLNVEELVFGDMNLYPNPTDGLVYISNANASETFSYELLDVKGQVLSAKTAGINGSATTEISLENLEPGVYMIRVYNSDAEKTFRVIKQ